MVDLEALKKEYGLPPRHSAALRAENTAQESRQQRHHFRFTMAELAIFLAVTAWLATHGHIAVGAGLFAATLLAMAVVVMAHHWYRDLLEEDDA